MMRKLFLFLLGLLLWGAAYSDPASIFQYKIEPTEGQKAEFFRKARKDPELYSYNPMHVGNVWWYVTYWHNPYEPDSQPYKGREIVDSTFINGNKYYRFNPHYGSLQDFWLRNIGDVTMLWDHHDIYNDLDDNPNTDFFFFFYFTITTHNPDDPCLLWIWTLYNPYFPFGCYLVDTGWIHYYGQITQYRQHNYIPLGGDMFYTTIWIRGFGPVYRATDEADVNLYGCIINGTSYGEIPSSNDDFNIPAIDDILLNVYPNPSQQGFDISYNIPKEYGVSKLTIYNLRGQKVLQAEVRGSGVLHWDGRDTMQNKLASGIYLIQIVSTQGMNSIRKVTVK